MAPLDVWKKGTGVTNMGCDRESERRWCSNAMRLAASVQLAASERPLSLPASDLPLRHSTGQRYDKPEEGSPPKTVSEILAPLYVADHG